MAAARCPLSPGAGDSATRAVTDVKYLLEALQVEWDKNSIVYGCPIRTIMRVLEAKLQEYHKSQQGNGSGT